MQPTQLIQEIKAVCGPEFLKKPYKKLRPRDAHPTWGCCYVACEVLYHQWAKKRGFKPHWVSVKGCTCSANCTGGSHWYLRNPETSEVLDPTVEQFGGIIPDYEEGVCCGFLTKAPSNRCKRMLSRIEQQRKEHEPDANAS